MSDLFRTDCCTSICQGFIIHVAMPVLPLALSMFHVATPVLPLALSMFHLPCPGIKFLLDTEDFATVTALSPRRQIMGSANFARLVNEFIKFMQKETAEVSWRACRLLEAPPNQGGLKELGYTKHFNPNDRVQMATEARVEHTFENPTLLTREAPTAATRARPVIPLDPSTGSGEPRALPVVSLQQSTAPSQGHRPQLKNKSNYLYVYVGFYIFICLFFYSIAVRYKRNGNSEIGNGMAYRTSTDYFHMCS